MMEYFEIYIPQDVDLSKFKFEIPFYEWDGVKYPQGNPESRFFENFILEQSSGEYIIQQTIPEKYKNIPLQQILIKGDDLNDIRSLIGNPNYDLERQLRNLVKMLEEFTRHCIQWAVYVSRDPDSLPYNRIVRGNTDVIIKHLHSIFNREIDDFVVYA